MPTPPAVLPSCTASSPLTRAQSTKSLLTRVPGAATHTNPDAVVGALCPLTVAASSLSATISSQAALTSKNPCRTRCRRFCHVPGHLRRSSVDATTVARAQSPSSICPIISNPSVVAIPVPAASPLLCSSLRRRIAVATSPLLPCSPLLTMSASLPRFHVVFLPRFQGGTTVASGRSEHGSSWVDSSRDAAAQRKAGSAAHS
ncbi:hypothetical protein M0R45_015942 [Rubus argutus]|uniref:Uncharacterized protein n=1 Tax=Rubus argutus TaxID=59490 RepID=A0AAW1XTJ1_RUBAR